MSGFDKVHVEGDPVREQIAELVRLPWTTPRFEIVDIATDTRSAVQGVDDSTLTAS